MYFSGQIEELLLLGRDECSSGFIVGRWDCAFSNDGAGLLPAVCDGAVAVQLTSVWWHCFEADVVLKRCPLSVNLFHEVKDCRCGCRCGGAVGSWDEDV